MVTRYLKDHIPDFRNTGDTVQIDNPVTFSNTLTVEGTFTFGDAATDNLIVAGDLRINDDRFLHFGTGEDVSIEYDEDGTNDLRIIGADWVFDDDLKLYFGTGKDAYIEYDEDGNDTLSFGGTNILIEDDLILYFGSGKDASILYDETTDDKMEITCSNGINVTGVVTFVNKIDGNGSIDILDEQDGGAANGPIVKKQLQAGEDYTTTTAGLMVKNYGDASATVSSGEFTGLYVNLKGLHTDPGNNTSLISAHVHSSNTTTVHAGLWLYGDMTNGIKMSGSTLTSAIDISEATAVTHLFDLPAGGTAPVTAATGAVGSTTHKIAIDVGGTTRYLVVYDDIGAS